MYSLAEILTFIIYLTHFTTLKSKILVHVDYYNVIDRKALLFCCWQVMQKAWRNFLADWYALTLDIHVYVLNCFWQIV